MAQCSTDIAMVAPVVIVVDIEVAFDNFRTSCSAGGNFGLVTGIVDFELD